MEKDLHSLEKKIKVKFQNFDLLREAFVHRSYLNEHPRFALPHNERLEFLGDAVLELVTTEFLFLNYPNPEGDLTNWRASLVNSKILSQVARDLSLGDFLLLSKGESQDMGKARQFILANTLEALIGAIFLDQGLSKAKKFISQFVLVHLPEILEKKLYVDPKSHFQELAQEKTGVTPNYKVLQESGPDHAKQFKIGIYLNKELVATGKGTSKQEAQEMAAREALKNKTWGK